MASHGLSLSSPSGLWYSRVLENFHLAYYDTRQGSLISRIMGHFKNFSFWRTVPYQNMAFQYFFPLFINKPRVGTRVGILASYY